MAIVRRKNFAMSGPINPQDISLIDTPEKLLSFIRNQNLGSVPLNVEKVANALGLSVEYVTFPKEDSDLSGKLFYDDKNNIWTIHVNTEHHPNRQRYTIAHEIGHFCLHKHLQNLFEDKIFFRGGEPTKEEWQANDFASSILMPENIFIEKVRAGIREVEDLASFFKVSTLALRLRAKNLGILGHGL